MNKIKKNDNVQIMTGRDKGRQGVVSQVLPEAAKVVIAGLNQYKKHRKPMGDRAGEIITLDRPIDIAKIALICPLCKTPTRVGFLVSGETKSRICKKCKGLIDAPKKAEAAKPVKKVAKAKK